MLELLTQSDTGDHNNFIVDFMQSQRRAIKINVTWDFHLEEPIKQHFGPLGNIPRPSSERRYLYDAFLSVLEDHKQGKVYTGPSSEPWSKPQWWEDTTAHKVVAFLSWKRSGAGFERQATRLVVLNKEGHFREQSGALYQTCRLAFNSCPIIQHWGAVSIPVNINNKVIY